MSGIASEDDWIASFKGPLLRLVKTTTRTTVAAVWYSMFDVAGQPGAGTLAGGQASGASTAAGIVPTDATAGYPQITDFASGALGYISTIEGSNSVASRIKVYDRLFVAGAYNFNANTTLASQPSYSGRLPFKSDGTTVDYSNLELWAEQVTVGTGVQHYTVTYTDQDGNTGHTTGDVTGITTTPVGRCIQLPLASGDSGLRKVESVLGGTATVGTFNIMVLRPLGTLYVPVANGGEIQDMFRNRFLQVFQDSALYMLVSADSTSSGLPDVSVGIVSK